MAIDGSNLYWMDTQAYKVTPSPGKQYSYPEYPHLEYVQACVDFCLRENIAFHVFFDAPAPFHFIAADERKSPPGILNKFETLLNLRDHQGNSLVTKVMKGQADPHILERARAWNQQGFDSFIITNDKFVQNEFEKYQDVLGPREHDWPERVLSAMHRSVNGQSELVFSRFPGSTGFFSIPVHGDQSRQASEARIETKFRTTEEKSTKIENFGFECWPLTIQAPAGQMTAGQLKLHHEADGSWNLSLGRDDNTNAKRLHFLISKSFTFVSGQHLQIQYQATTGAVTLKDTSTNGTWLGQKRLSKNVPTTLNTAHNLVTLSGTDHQDGVVSLVINLANISFTAADADGQEMRAITSIRPPVERAPTQQRPAPHQNTSELILQIDYPNGDRQTFKIHPQRLPFYIASDVSGKNNVAQLNSAISPSVASTSIKIQSIQQDSRTQRIRAVLAECSILQFDYAIDGYISDDVRFIWNVGHDNTQGNEITLAPNGSQFGVKLRLYIQ